MLLKFYRKLKKKTSNYKNPELPKSSVTLDNYRLAWRLLVKNRVPFYFPVLFLLPIFFLVPGVVNWYGKIIKLGGSISEYFAYSGVLIMTIWLYFSIFRAAIPNWPSTFMSQTFSYKTRWTTNVLGFTGLTFFGVAAVVSFVEEFIISGSLNLNSLPDDSSNLLASIVLVIVYLLIILIQLVILVSIVAFLIYLWVESWRVITRVSNWWYKRGALVATFDKEVYESGDEFLLQIRDKISKNSGRQYRIHLSYVWEETTIKKERSTMWDIDGNTEYADSYNYRRHLTYTKFRDVTAGELHEGISWSIPVFEKPGVPINHFPLTKFIKGKECRYWELLVEEHNSYFYAQFFLNVDTELKDKVADNST